MSKLYNPDYLQSLCQKYNLAPSKKYGQNYLLDEIAIETIVAAADLNVADTIIEVGPGFGVLTLALVASGARIVSYEIEKKLAPYWEATLKKIQAADPKATNLEIVWGNVLRSFTPPTGAYKVVANVPFQITSALIRLFLEAEHRPERLVLMIQKEVAERICAAPGQMSLLALSVQYYATSALVASVPRTAFWPVPAVDSAIIAITPHVPVFETPAKTEFFFSLVKAGFAQRRKLLSKNLLPLVGKKHAADLKQIFTDLGLAPTVRAQELSLETWAALADRLSTYT